MLCEVVTGVNPWVSSQHPTRPAFTQVCRDTHVSQPGSGELRPRWRLSFHYWGFGKAQRDDSTGDNFLFLFCLIERTSSFSRCPRSSGLWGTRRRLLWNNIAVFRSNICRVLICPRLLPPRRGNDGLCQGYWAWLWLVRRLSTISIKTATAAGLITGPKEDPDEKTMSPLHSWVGGDTNPHVICKFNVIVYFIVACSTNATTIDNLTRFHQNWKMLGEKNSLVF